MEPAIRPYRPEDDLSIAELMVELQEHIVVVDPLKRNRCEPGYGEQYTKILLDRITKNNGWMLVAEEDGQVIGCVAVIPEEHSLDEELNVYPVLEARIIELVVSKKVRGRGIGSQLMQAAEETIRVKNYNSVRVEVFAPNADAHAFYEKIGYHDRCIDMLKML